MIVPSGILRRSRLARVAVTAVAACGLAFSGVAAASAAHTAKPAPTYKPEAGGSPQTAKAWTKPNAIGGLDCNGVSPIQKTVNNKVCTDIKGINGVNNSNTWGGRFYDNGRYIGHDEPIVRYFSGRTGSGNNVVWRETLGTDPAAAPTVKTPGKDVTHTVELTVAPWFGMALCDPFSYPLLPCKPGSDVNAPATVNAPVPAGVYPGAGSSFLEMQFYPPGMAPFVDNISCDNTHWCASLHINDLECSLNFASCNPHCEEPTNFAFIETNGVPTGPPSPQLSDIATSTPDSHTLLMNSGDKLVIHMSDAAVPGATGQKALKLTINDLTTGQSGFMQVFGDERVHAAISIQDCSGTPFNYQPEYNSAGPAQHRAVGGGPDRHRHPVRDRPLRGVHQSHQPVPRQRRHPRCERHVLERMHRPVRERRRSRLHDTGDGRRFLLPVFGDTHNGAAPPNVVSGCEGDNVLQNKDLDFDGNPYWADWPNSTKPNTFPSTFLQAQPTTNGVGYPQFQFQTDAALSGSELRLPERIGLHGPAPGGPGKFYPYWTLTKSCVWEFGNNTNGNTFGKDAQYGSIKTKIGYPQMFGPVMKNGCDT